MNQVNILGKPENFPSASILPSVEPVKVPSSVTRKKPSILPIPEPYHLPFIVCEENVTPYVVSNGENFGTTQYFILFSYSTNGWINNSYFLKSCFSLGFGYVYCCPLKPPQD